MSKLPDLLKKTGAAGSRLILRLAVYAVGIAIAVAAGFAAQAWWRHPPLSPWHTVKLDEEFRAGREAPDSFAGYLAQEARLFRELEREIHEPSEPGTLLDRYAKGSLTSRIALGTPGNRTHESGHANPAGAAVMLHGLSDAPYSLAAIGRELHARGFHVVWLRLPGHGTAPSALTTVDWRDWMAATKLALAHAAAQAPGKPLYVAGYSTGGALAMLHTLRAMDDPTLALPTRLFLFSPAIGLPEVTAMTSFASLFSFLPGLERAAWLDVLPEYDPYKFNSFPVNAARQIWALTRELDRAMDHAHGRRRPMPPVIAFQSLVDATVVAADVGTRLFKRLPAEPGHELVVFDVNRSAHLQSLIPEEPRRAFDRAMGSAVLPFRMTVVGNASPETREVAQWIREPGARQATPRATGLAWPEQVFSLGHLALAIPVDDPMYGLEPRRPQDGLAIPLGRGAPSGEDGALSVPLGQFARIRSNPFFPLILERIDAAVATDRASSNNGRAAP